jgi:hypothetical protein
MWGITIRLCDYTEPADDIFPAVFLKNDVVRNADVHIFSTGSLIWEIFRNSSKKISGAISKFYKISQKYCIRTV